MGQKVNPTGIRLGIVKDHASVWYAERGAYADKLNNDLEVRSFLEERLKNASVSRIHIERPANNARITIHTARPGIVIGKKGEDVDRLRRDLHAINEELNREGGPRRGRATVGDRHSDRDRLHRRWAGGADRQLSRHQVRHGDHGGRRECDRGDSQGRCAQRCRTHRRSQGPDGLGEPTRIGRDGLGTHRAAATGDRERDLTTGDPVPELVLELHHDRIGKGLVDRTALEIPRGLDEGIRLCRQPGRGDLQ